MAGMQIRQEDVSAVCDMLTSDLNNLLEETKKLEGFGHQLAGLFSQSDAPNVKELCGDAVLNLQQRRAGMTSLEPIRKSLVYLRPFLAACEQKHTRLVPCALATIAKFVQRRLISHEGRVEIVKMLINRQLEKVKDERALLSALQICLALLQDPSYADDEQGIGQLLSLVLRVHDAHSVAMPTVAHTASSTVRQAVALIFDHAMLPVDHVGVTLGHTPVRRGEAHGSGSGSYQDMEGLSGREVAALKLLKDLITWVQNIDKLERPQTAHWLSCKPPVSEFLLDLLEIIIKERAQAFHSMPRFTVALRNEVCTTLGNLLRCALSEKLPPMETIKVLRCVGAVLRRHVTLAPDKCALFFQELLRCLQNLTSPVLMRCHVLDIFRGICSEPMLVYKLFEMYDQAIEFDLNAVSDMLGACARYPDQLLRRHADPQNQYREEYLTRLENYYQYRTNDNKDPAHTIMETQSLTIENSADVDVLPAYLSIELASNLMGTLEQLAVRVRGADAIAVLHSLTSGKLPTRPSAGSLRTRGQEGAGLQTPTSSPPVTVQAHILSSMVDNLWRPLTALIDPYLQLHDRRTETSMTLPLVTCYQYIIYAAGVVHSQTALDGLLAQLCAYAITGPEDKARKDAIARAPQYECGNLLLNTLASTQAEVNELWPKNRTVLKAVLELTKMLAEDLKSGWLYVLDVINCLDRYLELPGSKWKNENDRPDDGYRRRLDTQGELDRERVKPGTGKDLQKEKEQWRYTCDEVFITSWRLNSDAVVELMHALHEVSRITLSDSWKSHQETHKLDMLKQALQVLTANLHLTPDLWGSFLSHCMLVLRSVNESARAAALKALDEGIMRALSPEAVAAARQEAEASSSRRAAHAAATGSPYLARHVSPFPSPGQSYSGAADGEEGRIEDIQNMLLVAVDSLYREHGKLDVQLGLLKIVVHVLQHYGEDLTLGWVPLLRLLEAASGCKEMASVTLGWQCVELLCSDYLYMLPKEHIPKALSVLALFANQDMILNVSLTAVTMLWNVADTLARSKGVTATVGSSAGAIPGSPGAVVSTNDRRDVSGAESVEMLLVAFRALKSLSLDSRPEVRNSAVRTLFMAMGCHGSKFPTSSLRECVWDMTLPLITTCHHLSQTSSNLELGPSEIGKNKEGKVVTMLMHHSRNTEQKQWEETLMLTVAGATKVLRGLLPAIRPMEGWHEAWQELMEVLGEILAVPRKGLSNSCTTLINTLITSHGSNQEVLPPTEWRAALMALDKGVVACAGPGANAPLQVRTELLSCISAVHSVLRDYMGEGDVRQVLGWLDRFARYPLSADDTPLMLCGMSPIQKATLSALQQLAPAPAGVWPDLLQTVCDMLCPFKLLPYRSQLTPTTSAVTSPTKALTAADQPPTDAAGLPSTASGLSGAGSSVAATQDALVFEAKVLTTTWMARCTELIAGWYKEHVPWQVRVMTFPTLISALSECMAVRYVDSADELWRCAASAFIAVVQSGLPSINIASHTQLSSSAAAGQAGQVLGGAAGVGGAGGVAAVPTNTWTVLSRAFEMFLLGKHLPEGATQPTHGLLSVTTSAPRGSLEKPPLLPTSGGSSEGAQGQPAAATDVEVQASVLDCLADSVLTSCQYAPPEVRLALVRIIDQGSAAPLPREGDGPAAGRFSHACLSKLYVLCSRGWDTCPRSSGQAGRDTDAGSERSSSSGIATPTGELNVLGLQAYLRSGSMASRPSLSDAAAGMPKDQSSRCLVEVAQLALPSFLARCEVILQSYTTLERLAVASSGSSLADVDAVLTDRAIHVLDLLCSLRVSPIVMETVLSQRPDVRMWVDLARAHRRMSPTPAPPPGSAQDKGEQTHLVLFYGTCTELLMSSDKNIRASVKGLLQALGREIGLPLLGDSHRPPVSNGHPPLWHG